MMHIFLHGLGQDASAWDKLLAALPIEGTCPELFSFLDGEPTYRALYRGFSGYCEGLDGPVSLCGLSLGAVLALQYAAEHPERVASLVLIAPQYKSPKALLRLQDLIFALMPEKAFGDTGLDKSTFRALTRSMGELDLTAKLGAVRYPTLVLCGEKDKANRKAAESLARLLPSAELKLVPAAGHEVNVDAPEALAEILTEFYQKCS